ncbi:MAG: recombination protein O N-terminal domain-containing protein [Candidatus Pacebacteria bacterium]|nr:recombination protein O N-terminal domain-containing protein [Candidatus Paceibacterota bacterium]
MHNIYTTKAIIIKSISVGEANKLYLLLTKDLGFIKATAQGVRLVKSKLRYSLQDFYCVNISLVRGKEIWRITSVQNTRQIKIIGNLKKISVIKDIFALLLRLIHGEEKNEKLFECIETFYNFIFDNSLNEEELKDLETLVVLRILYNLGYFKKIEKFISYCDSSNISLLMLRDFNNIRKQAILEINLSLKETHL